MLYDNGMESSEEKQGGDAYWLSFIPSLARFGVSAGALSSGRWLHHSQEDY